MAPVLEPSSTPYVEDLVAGWVTEPWSRPQSALGCRPPMKTFHLPLLLVSGLVLACQAAGPADLILHNGLIETVDEAHGEVQALAVRKGRILAVGSDEVIDAFRGPGTRVLDLQGRRAIPGFIEGHGHFPGVGEMLRNLDLTRTRNWSEVVELVRERARSLPPGQWIVGRGWHQEKWNSIPAETVEGFPVHAALSAVSPDHPVCLEHASGHACFFNARAMELAGIDGDSPDPPGGEILRQENGAPSGLFRETAADLVLRARRSQLSERSLEEAEADLRRTLALADRECLSKGVTSFQDAGSPFDTIAVMRKMAQAGELNTRLWVMVSDTNERLAAELGDVQVRGAFDRHFTVAAIKRHLDGALGSRGAWLLEPYSDSPQSTGLNTATLESVRETARIAREHGVQLCVHAIGDRANRELLDLYEQALGPEGLASDHRWRIEHAQHLHPDDIPRFGELGIVASMQAVHCTSDGPWVEARLGAVRAREGAYVWRSLMDHGVLISNGTDAPVEDVDPIACFFSAVTRKTASGEPFYPDQRMNRLEALRSYTLNCAKAAFEEDIKGSLTPGKLADIVVLSHDILTVPEEEIRQSEVLWTFVGGDLVYSAPGVTPGP